MFYIQSPIKAFEVLLFFLLHAYVSLLSASSFFLLRVDLLKHEIEENGRVDFHLIPLIRPLCVVLLLLFQARPDSLQEKMKWVVALKQCMRALPSKSFFLVLPVWVPDLVCLLPFAAADVCLCRFVMSRSCDVLDVVRACAGLRSLHGVQYSIRSDGQTASLPRMVRERPFLILCCLPAAACSLHLVGGEEGEIIFHFE